MTSLLTNIFETHFKDKELEEKLQLYKSLAESSTFETFQFFALFDKALDEIIGTDICDQLYSKLLENLKTKQSDCEITLFHKIVDKYTTKSLRLQMSATGWNVLKGNSTVCHNYFKLRNIKLQPTIQNIQVLNAIRKHNVHICDNHIKHWSKTKKLTGFLSTTDQFIKENINDLIKFFSKLSSSVIKLIITEQQKSTNRPKIYFPILCNKVLDQTDIDSLFKIYQMNGFIKAEHVDNYFLHVNSNIFEKYWNTISCDNRPHHNLITFIDNTFSENVTLTQTQIKNIIDFALFFHVKVKPAHEGRFNTTRATHAYKESYLNMITRLINNFSIEQQLKLNKGFISNFNLANLCDMHFDPLVLYVVGNNHDIDALCEALITCDTEVVKYVDIVKNIMDVLLEDECEELDEESEVTLTLQFTTCVESLNKEKQDLLFKQIIKSNKTISQQLLLRFDQIYKGEIIKQLYHACIIDRLKKYKLDTSLAQVDTSISSENMLNVIFDKSEIEFGKCNICWEKNIAFTCKSCGNCSCETCVKQLSRCAICKTHRNFLKLHM